MYHVAFAQDQGKEEESWQELYKQRQALGNNRPAQGKLKEEADWRELYNKRQALALAVETKAAEVAGVRARVEALWAKTRWTEANARR